MPSMYSFSVPIFQRGLQNLSVYLDAIETHASEKGIAPGELLSARLIDDMLPLSGQYQRASDTAKLAIARLAGIDAPRFEDNETTVADLRERLKKTQDFLATVTPATMEGSDTREVTISPGGNKIVFNKGEDYLAKFALPNFFFHVTTAHDILRSRGLPVGKQTYLGQIG
ncbi:MULTISPECIES: DUF1993 domain-containing protein [unclassified Rhizobium]|uniref:DUF1993 domain-containing protein n=1 Tax=unclassified Rhizobium TaxID=2613769 RepID=UPI000EA83B32|nr:MULTISPECIES: DUF1993 domain-containing protein [unclassified Rhizobium]AYG67898.1 DUF1993 domain-containing protein [Rhizobium sp. CCGE531]AYG74290.1 DUF1993 domain-containing protein [Rhizobium sp. CCGE532]